MTTPPPPTPQTSVLQLPGGFNVPGVAPVYVDAVPVNPGGPNQPGVNPGGPNKPPVNPGGPNRPPPNPKPKPPPPPRQQGPQDFWSTDLRGAADPVYEQLVITLAQIRPLNYLRFDLAHFPHTVSFWWWDGARWQPVARPNGAPLEIITTGSVPTIVDNPAALMAGLNPYHYGAGHWVRHDEMLTQVSTSKLMLRLQRLSQATGGEKFPVNPRGEPCPYPLGVRNLDFGTRLRSCDDAPYALRDPDDLTRRQPFATSQDVKGSPIQVAIRENRACDLLRGQ